MRTVMRFAMAVAAGAAIMYFFDPVVGRRRRARVRDKGRAARHSVEELARAKSRHAAQRVQGVVARARARLMAAPVEDDLLRERIRAKLGRVLARPSAVAVEVHDGQVVLTGGASAEEIDTLMAVVGSMLGVGGVESRLQVDDAHALRSGLSRH